MVLTVRIELTTSPLPRERSTPELRKLITKMIDTLERVAGIEPAPSAWKAEVLPLNYTREEKVVEGDGFEPSKHIAADLQSAPFGHSGTPPRVDRYCI